MKRGFLFGLGSFLVLGVIAGLLEAFRGSYLVAALMIALFAPTSVLVIRKANEAAPNKSNLHAFFGWLIGFCIINGVAAFIIWAIAS